MRKNNQKKMSAFPFYKFWGAVVFSFLLLIACGEGNKENKRSLSVKDTASVTKDTVRKSTHQTDYEKFKKGTVPIKNSPEQIIRF